MKIKTLLPINIGGSVFFIYWGIVNILKVVVYLDIGAR